MYNSDYWKHFTAWTTYGLSNDSVISGLLITAAYLFSARLNGIVNTALQQPWNRQFRPVQILLCLQMKCCLAMAGMGVASLMLRVPLITESRIIDVTICSLWYNDVVIRVSRGAGVDTGSYGVTAIARDHTRSHLPIHYISSNFIYYH